MLALQYVTVSVMYGALGRRRRTGRVCGIDRMVGCFRWARP